MPKARTRVVEFDILRAFAIIVIVFGDSIFFLQTVKIPYSGLIVDFSVALFLFISGFVLYLNHPSFPQRNSLANFCKKKECSGFSLCIG